MSGEVQALVATATGIEGDTCEVEEVCAFDCSTEKAVSGLAPESEVLALAGEKG